MCYTLCCSGLLPSLIGVCHVAIQFPLYEACKKSIAEYKDTSPDRLDPLSLVRLTRNPDTMLATDPLTESLP